VGEIKKGRREAIEGEKSMETHVQTRSRSRHVVQTGDIPASMAS
jgi:hypothetical protein